MEPPHQLLMLRMNSTGQSSCKLNQNESVDSYISTMLQHIDWSIRDLDFQKLINSLDHQYVLNFPVDKLINSKNQKHIFQFFRKFFRLIYLKINQNRLIRANKEQQQHLNRAVISAIFQIKECYCKLAQILPRASKIEHLQIVCFVTALLSRTILTDYAKTLEESECEKHPEIFEGEEEVKGGCEIEEEIYIIVIFQTVGQLISPYVYPALKKKYIKQRIFQSGQTTHRTLVRSLKHIKENITKKDVVLNRRKKCQNDQSEGARISFKLERESMKNLLKESLKIRESFSLKRSQEVDKKARMINFYRSEQNSGHQIAIKIPKQCSVKAISSSAKFMYKFASKYDGSMIKQKLLSTNLLASGIQVKKKFKRIEIPKESRTEIKSTNRFDSLTKQMNQLQTNKSVDSLIEKISQSYRFRLERNTTPWDLTETSHSIDLMRSKGSRRHILALKEKENQVPSRKLPQIIPEMQQEEERSCIIQQPNWRKTVVKSQADKIGKVGKKSQKLRKDKKRFEDNCDVRKQAMNTLQQQLNH